MPRRRYYRRSVRVVAPRKKWATNIKQGSIQAAISGSTGEGFATLVANSPQTTVPTPVIIKSGNFKIQGDCQFAATSGAISTGMAISLFVMYLPEAFTASAGTLGGIAAVIDAHPEWIVAWKALDISAYTGTLPSSNGTAGFSFSSRLKRNLNSGDGIYLVVVVREASSSGNLNVRVNYTTQYWTCAN